MSEDLKARIEKWVSSPKGQAELKTTSELVRKTIEQIKVSTKVNHLDMLRPMDI